jgi:hypothetical protein
MRIMLRNHLVPGTGLFQNKLLWEGTRRAIGQLCTFLIRRHRSICRGRCGWHCRG